MDNQSNGKIGLFGAVFILVGSMIGSAIFSLSGLTLYTSGPAAILSWLIAAAVQLVYGMVVAELATIYPKSGGVFVFPALALGGPDAKNKSVGAFWGWVSTWGYVLSNVVAVAFSAIYVGTYLGAGFGLGGEWQIPLAVISVAVCLLLNAINFSTAGKLNTVLVSALVAALAVFVGFALFGGSWKGELLLPLFTQGAGGTFGFLSSVPTAMVGYGAIVSMAFMVSEVREPKKNVPRSMLIAMAIVAGIYVLVLFATAGIVSASALAENEGMRYIPLYAACFEMTAYPFLAKVVSVAAVLALLTTMLVLLALTGRALAAAGEAKTLPAIFASQGKGGTPLFATAIVAAVAAVVSCFPAFTETMVGLGALFGALTTVINIISLYAARKKNPYIPGSFRTPGGAVLPAVILAVIILSYVPDVIGGGWLIWAYTAALYAVGILIYRFCSK